jgi:riboflavin transport system permease protein
MSRRSRARVVALAAALAFAALYALVASSDPKEALYAFFVSPFASPYAFLSFLESSASLLCCSLGACIAFRAGAFNLGGEGQAAVGTLAAALAAASLGGGIGGNPPGALGIALAILAAALAGSALAFLSALAERKAGAQVMLTSFLFGQAAIILVNWAVGGPLKDPSANLLGMAAVPEGIRLPLLAPPSPLSLAFPLSLLFAAGLALFTRGTRAGVEQRLYGKGRAFARAAGFSPRIGDWSMAASGALSGIGGALLVLGQAGRAFKDMTGGIGWNGLAVALVAGSDGLGALPAALFFSWLDSGSRQASMLADLSPDSSAVMKGIALFLITATATRLGGRERRRGS